MRPQQHGRRQRSRGSNNNRRNQNPLSRSYESNGPDVKIRGNAQQVADKYGALARDAQASGDRVMAENYLQHAEHYNRIIMAAQAQSNQDDRERRDEGDSGSDTDVAAQDQSGDDKGNDGGSRSRRSRGERRNRDDRNRDEAVDGQGEQPVLEGTPAEVALSDGAAANGDASNDGAEEPEKPKRKRRTKAEMEAARAAENDPSAEAEGTAPAA